MRLYDNLVELVKDLVLVLWVLAEREDQVLSCHAARLRASKEESEAFVDNTSCPILEVLISQKDSQKITSLCACWISLQFCASFGYYILTHCAERPRISSLVSLKRCQVISGQKREHDDVRGCNPFDQV